MTAIVDGPIHWDLSRGDDGHRDYTLKWQLHTTDKDDGPGIVMEAAGLPVIGSSWTFGNDNDPWAFCWPNLKVSPLYQKEACDIWIVEQTFSTRPFSRCSESQIESPFQEPWRISGTFIKMTKIGTHDRFGRRIQTPSFEPITGGLNEWDDSRPTVMVGHNEMFLPLTSYSAMIDRVNDGVMWGLPRRTIKLSNVRWARAVYGTCSYYYPVDYEFEIKYDTWDRIVQNDATKVLKSGGDPANPKDYSMALDQNGNPTNVILNEDGTEWDGTGDAPTTDVEYYEEANFFALDIPSSLQD